MQGDEGEEFANLLRTMMHQTEAMRGTTPTNEGNAVNALRSFLQLASQTKEFVHENGAKSETKGPCDCGYKHWLEDKEYDYIFRFELTRNRTAMLGYSVHENIYEVAQNFVAKNLPDTLDPQKIVVKIADCILQKIASSAGYAENNDNSILTLDLSSAPSVVSNTSSMVTTTSPYSDTSTSTFTPHDTQGLREQIMQEQRKEKRKEEEQKNQLRQQMLLQRKEREANERLKKTTQSPAAPARQLPPVQHQQPPSIGHVSTTHPQQPQHQQTQRSQLAQPRSQGQPFRFREDSDDESDNEDEEDEEDEDEEETVARLDWARKILQFKREELMEKTRMNEQHAALVFKLAQDTIDRQQQKGKQFKAFSGHGHTLAVNDLDDTRLSFVEPSTIVASSVIDLTQDDDPEFRLDDLAPKTTLQIRMHNNTRLVGTFNLTHRISDVKLWLKSQQPALVAQQYELLSSYPVRKLTDLNQTIQEAGIQNSAVIQKLLP